MEKLKKEDQKTVIFELEGLAIAAALSTFSEFAKGRRVVIFTEPECSVLPDQVQIKQSPYEPHSSFYMLFRREARSGNLG